MTRTLKKKIGLSIKPSTKKDALAIAKNLPSFFNDVGIASMTKDFESHEIWGAFVKENLSGFISLRKADKRSLEVSWLAVKKDSQGIGIGSALIKEVLNKYAEKGFSICYVKTLAETVEDEGYAKTRSFYKNLGFCTLEIIDPYPGWSEGNPCLVLAVALPLK